MRVYIYIGSLILPLLTAACSHDTVKSTWDNILSRCAYSEALGNDVVYFGTSNDLGPGTIFRKTDDGGYNLRRTVDELTTDSTARGRLVHLGEASSCTGTETTQISLSTSALLNSDLTPIQADLSLDLAKGHTIMATIDSWALDFLNEGLFEDMLFELPVKNRYRSDAFDNNRVIVVKAVRVHGFSSELKFSKEATATLKAKYDFSEKFNIGGGLNALWKDDNVLTVKSANDFYVIGELGRLKGDGFAFGGATYSFEKVHVNSDVKLGKD